MAEIDSGTMAAAVPIEVPTMRRVSGISATRRMMKGSERKALTTAPSPLLTQAFSQIPLGAVPTSTSPSGRPTTKLMAPDTSVITTVCCSAASRGSSGTLGIAEDLHDGAGRDEVVPDPIDELGPGVADGEKDDGCRLARARGV